MDYYSMMKDPTGQNQIYNALGRNAGLNNSNNPLDFFSRKARSAANAFGTTGAAIASFVKDSSENADTENQRMWRNRGLDAVYNRYGFRNKQDYYDQIDQAEREGNQARLNELLNNTALNDELKAAANANAEQTKAKADAYDDWRKNNYVSQKINQDQGKFLGSAMNTLSTGFDIASTMAGIPNGALINGLQGGFEGIADELEENGFKDFDWGRAGQNAAVGLASGMATGALNTGLDKAGIKNFLGNNMVTRGLAKSGLGNVALNLGNAAAKGALTGAVGGGVGAGTASALGGQDIGQGLANTLQGALRGAGSGAVVGGTMAGISGGTNAALGRFAPRVAESLANASGANENKGVKSAWDSWRDSGENFTDRLYNTLDSQEGAAGRWLNGKQSPVLQRAGQIGNRIQPVDNWDQSLRDAGDLLNAYNSGRRFDIRRNWTEFEDDFRKLPTDTQEAVIRQFDNYVREADADAVNAGEEFDNYTLKNKLAEIHKQRQQNDQNLGGLPFYKKIQNGGNDINNLKRQAFETGTPEAVSRYLKAEGWPQEDIDIALGKLPEMDNPVQEMNKLSDVHNKFMGLGFSGKGWDKQYQTIQDDIDNLRFANNASSEIPQRFVGVNPLGQRSEYTLDEMRNLIDEYRNYQSPRTLSGNSSSEASEVLGPAGDKLVTIYNTMHGGNTDPVYNRADGQDFLRWIDEIAGGTQTNGNRSLTDLAKRAGRRIAEDLSNTNLGNRIKNVSDDEGATRSRTYQEMDQEAANFARELYDWNSKYATGYGKDNFPAPAKLQTEYLLHGDRLVEPMKRVVENLTNPPENLALAKGADPKQALAEFQAIMSKYGLSDAVNGGKMPNMDIQELGGVSDYSPFKEGHIGETPFRANFDRDYQSLSGVMTEPINNVTLYKPGSWDEVDAQWQNGNWLGGKTTPENEQRLKQILDYYSVNNQVTRKISNDETFKRIKERPDSLFNSDVAKQIGAIITDNDLNMYQRAQQGGVLTREEIQNSPIAKAFKKYADENLGKSIITKNQEKGIDPIDTATMTRLNDVAAEFMRTDKSLQGAKNEGRAVIVLGMPASGKSSNAVDPYVEQGFFNLDNDNIKKLFPEYNNGLGAGNVHEASSFVSNQLVLPEITKNRTNVVIPVIGKGLASLENYAKILKDAGYGDIHLINVDLPLDKTATRNFTRMMETSRNVDMDYIYDVVGNKPAENFNLIKERIINGTEPNFTSYETISTDVPFGTPARVLEDSRGVQLSGNNGEGYSERAGVNGGNRGRQAQWLQSGQELGANRVDDALEHPEMEVYNALTRGETEFDLDTYDRVVKAMADADANNVHDPAQWDDARVNASEALAGARTLDDLRNALADDGFSLYEIDEIVPEVNSAVSRNPMSNNPDNEVYNTLTGGQKSNQVDPEMVAMSTMLRDHTDMDGRYVNDEHKMLADIADTLYNANISPERLLPEYKALYDKYGPEYFNNILTRMGEIDDSTYREPTNDWAKFNEGWTQLENDYEARLKGGNSDNAKIEKLLRQQEIDQGPTTNDVMTAAEDLLMRISNVAEGKEPKNISDVTSKLRMILTGKLRNDEAIGLFNQVLNKDLADDYYSTRLTQEIRSKLLDRGYKVTTEDADKSVYKNYSMNDWKDALINRNSESAGGQESKPHTLTDLAKRAGRRAKEDLGKLPKPGLSTELVDNEGNEVGMGGNRLRPDETELYDQMDRMAKSNEQRRQAYDLLLQNYGTLSRRVTQATDPVETVGKMYEMGFERPAEVKQAVDFITGANGKANLLNRKLIAAAGKVNTMDGPNGEAFDDWLRDLTELEGIADGTHDQAVIKQVNAVLKSLDSRRKGTLDGTDDADAVFDVVQKLEAHARQNMGKSGRNYSTATEDKLAQASVLRQVANVLLDRIYDAAPDIKTVVTPEVIAEWKARFPKNERWAKWVDENIATAKSGRDLRAVQKPAVHMSMILDEREHNAGTYGSNVGGLANTAKTLLTSNKLGLAVKGAEYLANTEQGRIMRANRLLKKANKGSASPSPELPETERVAVGGGEPERTPVPTTSGGNGGNGGGSDEALTGEVLPAYEGRQMPRAPFNAIGRNEGLKSVNEPNVDVNGMADSVTRALQGNNSGTSSNNNGELDVYNSLAGNNYYQLMSNPGQVSGTGASAGTTTTTGGIQKTGDYWTDLIGEAMMDAARAGNYDAFGPLFEAYQERLSSVSGGGKSNLTNAQQTQMAKLDSAENAIDELESLFDQAGGAKGPIAGWLQGIGGNLGLDSGARTYNQMSEGLVNQIAQAIGKTDSLNTEGEVKRALQLIPQLTDDATTAKNKLETLRRMLSSTRSSYQSAYGIQS